ncbi:MAG: hypothetical protein K6G30_08720 [Acetatifactor sp.]|nr:hypothetical protein [Acetatifactor sp.]
MRELLRTLEQTSKQESEWEPKVFAATSKDKESGFLNLSGTHDGADDKKTHKPSNYNSREVATKIQRAKTSASAGLALIAAKRKVLEVKRKISTGDGDPKELQLALTHARRMEMVARKKKHHLELEEMAQTTGQRDERLQQEDTAADMKNAMISAQEEELAKKEDAVFEAWEELSDEMMADLNAMISELGDEVLEEMEKAMEMLESMEIIDPHMSKEELEELKRKHRLAEQKEMVKADMDYLKGMIKHQMQMGQAVPGVSTGTVAMPTSASVAMSSVPASGGSTIDVQL